MPAPNRKKFHYDYARPALTADVVVATRELQPRVLLIRRKHAPFAGDWALPGGFVDANERLIDAAKRELEEETGMIVTELEQLQAYGDPGRDPRGWTVSVAFLARIDPKKARARAGDDAAEAAWFSLAKLPALAFDHAAILARAAAVLALRNGA
jgi:8-oxo-dGTP diphosphatase